MGGEAKLSDGGISVGVSGGKDGTMPSGETGEDTGGGDASGGGIINPKLQDRSIRLFLCSI